MFLNHWQPGWRDCYHVWLTQVHQRSGSDATVTNYTSVIKRFFEACGKEPQLVLKSDIEIWASSPLVQGDKGKAPAAYTRNAQGLDHSVDRPQSMQGHQTITRPAQLPQCVT